MAWVYFLAGAAFAFVTMLIGLAAAVVRYAMKEFDHFLE